MLGLQAEDSFVLKVVQMEELLAVRHSVFVIGGPGTGKTQVNCFFNGSNMLCVSVESHSGSSLTFSYFGFSSFY